MMRFTASLLPTMLWISFHIGGAHADDANADLAYAAATEGTRILASRRSELEIKVLVEAANLDGDEVELAEIYFPAGYQSSGHGHGAIEIFYVLEGVLEHVVNGESHRLVPGQVGIVRPGDEVDHRVGDDGPCRALLVWAPGGEAERLAPYFDVRRLTAD